MSEKLKQVMKACDEYEKFLADEARESALAKHIEGGVKPAWGRAVKYQRELGFNAGWNAALEWARKNGGGK